MKIINNASIKCVKQGLQIWRIFGVKNDFL